MTLVESEVDAVAIPHVVRAANRRTVRDIHDEIRRIQAEPGRSAQRSGLLALTASFDHDIVDGAPAARFASYLRELMEGAEVLQRVL